MDEGFGNNTLIIFILLYQNVETVLIDRIYEL